MGEWKLVQMVKVTWPKWPPCPYISSWSFEYQRSGSFIDLVPNHSDSIFLNFFSSITTDFKISSALRWAIEDQWSSGISSPESKAHRRADSISRHPLSVRRLSSSTFSNDFSSEADSCIISHIASIGGGMKSHVFCSNRLEVWLPWQLGSFHLLIKRKVKVGLYCYLIWRNVFINVCWVVLYQAWCSFTNSSHWFVAMATENVESSFYSCSLR